MPHSLPILVVDDTELCRVSTTLLLLEEDFSCLSVESGGEALAVFEQGKFGAVIMDFELGDMTGADCTRLIRERERPGSHIPIIGLTAHELGEIRASCLEAGMDEVFSKDCSSKFLMKTLERLVTEKQGRN